MAIMAWVFDIFNEGITFDFPTAMYGNNTYTYVASFTVNFPSLDAIITDYDTGLVFGGAGSGMRFNELGDDIYFSLDSDGYEIIPLTGGCTVSPRTGNGDYGNWFHVNTGAGIGSTKRLWVNFRMTGTPAGGGRSGNVTVKVYNKPSNAASGSGFDSRPNGGNYSGSLKGV